MRCLVQTLASGRRRSATQATRLDAEVITIGRGTDRSVQLPDLGVALEHAEIRFTAAGVARIVSGSPVGFWINGQPRDESELSRGDEISIGANLLTVLEAPEGVDFALKVEVGKLALHGDNVFESHSRIGLAATKLRKRAWSWGLLVAVLVLFLAVPVSGFFDQGWRATLRQVGVVSDHAWDSGPLARAHHDASIGDDCNKCHQRPFVRVEDSACLQCHAGTPHHVSDAARIDPKSARCTLCHNEHNEPSTLVRRDERLCVDCHGRLADRFPDPQVEDVGDFSRTHPQLKVTLRVFGSGPDQPARTERVSLDDRAALIERSGILFSHKVHLGPVGDPNVVDVCSASPTECKQLSCVDCHRLEPGGRIFEPIVAKRDCLGCHALTFERRDPDREVPHLEAAVVRVALDEYYASRALAGGFDDAAAPEAVRARRIPGQQLSETERADALAWAQARAREEATVLFRLRCGQCHTSQTTAGDGEVDPDTWRIDSVRLTKVWMPGARFNHGAHFSHEKERDAQCGGCHDVGESERSSDVLMPAIATCRACHGGESDKNKVNSACVDCHGFHVVEGTVMESGGRR